MQTRLPNRERAERPSHRHAVDDDVIHGQYVLAFDREHDSAFVRRYHGERRTGEDGGGGVVAKRREEIGRRRPGSTNVRRDIAFGQGRKVRKDRKTGNIARETVAIMMYARGGRSHQNV